MTRGLRHASEQLRGKDQEQHCIGEYVGMFFHPVFLWLNYNLIAKTTVESFFMRVKYCDLPKFGPLLQSLLIWCTYWSAWNCVPGWGPLKMM